MRAHEGCNHQKLIHAADDRSLTVTIAVRIFMKFFLVSDHFKSWLSFFMSLKAYTSVCLIALVCSSISLAQTPQKPPEPQGMGGGVNTGAALNYASKRTVGITDPKGPIVFEDITDKTALSNVKQRTGSPAKNFIFEVSSGGVAIFDYDGDGLPDIYLLS